MRKASQTGSKKPVKMSAEAPPCEAPQECSDNVVVAEAAVTSSDVICVDERTSKLLAKKAERKAKKAQRQQAPEPTVLELAVPSGNAEKSDSEVLSQDGQ